MKNFKIGDNYLVHCYKHDGNIHVSYDTSMLLDVKKDYIILGNNRTKVTEADGRIWYTKEPAIVYYYKKRWFNIIAQFKENGIYYYCNMASPTIIEGKVIKYIDYDLDLRCFPDGEYKILDESEYEYHKNKMCYPKEVDMILKNELDSLIKLYKNKKGPFDENEIKFYYEKYMKFLKNN